MERPSKDMTDSQRNLAAIVERCSDDHQTRSCGTLHSNTPSKAILDVLAFEALDIVAATAITGGYATLHGIIAATSCGIVTVQFAQNVSSATTSRVADGSFLRVTEQ
jgi:hypothetical protein